MEGFSPVLCCAAVRSWGQVRWGEARWVEVCAVAYCEPFVGVHLNHPAQKVLTVWRDKVGHVENSQLHLLQKIPQVVVIKRQSALQKQERRKRVITTQRHNNQRTDTSTPAFSTVLCLITYMFSAVSPTSPNTILVINIQEFIWEEVHNFINYFSGFAST